MRAFRSRSIRQQTFVLFLIGAVLPVILIGAASIATIQDGLAQQAADGDRALAEAGADIVADLMGDFVVGVELTGSDPTLRSAVINNTSADAIRWALTYVAQNQSAFDAMALTDGDGTLIARWPPTAEWIDAADLSVETFVQVSATLIAGLYEPGPGLRLIPTSTVIRDDREVLRAVLIGFGNASEFGALLERIAVGNKDVFLHDGSGSLIASRSSEGRDSTARDAARVEAFEAGSRSEAFRAGSLRTGGENGQIAAYAPVPVATARWVLVTTQPLAAVFAQAASVFYVSLAIVASTGVVAAGLARTLARRTVEPVVALTGATRDLGRAMDLPPALLDRADEFGNLARSFQEMAEQVRAESAAKEELIGRLQELDRLKMSIIDTVSHELRTPITIIRGTAELMQTAPGGAEPRASRSSARIVQAADQLAYIVDELLEMSQIQAGVAAVNRTEVDVNEVVREAAALEASAAERQGVAIGLALEESVGNALADRPKLRILMRNLLSNAVKFSKRGGRVDVTCGRAGADVVVRVRDEGIGIPPETLESIFDPFFQADGSATRARGGAGIGLAVARNIASMHGGSLTAQSEPGKGSTFTLALPASGPPPPPP